ncbi:hypothetical protein V8C40DRAFT_28036 [Trichoderma camerunense]|uniref:Uncharacterized protein n=1 Tax=Trichoderma harzianum CBS 226.95 TaxID=983964 RepID=A0A2T4AQV9_TRIHA|nr:hypothetical protein M431DRAFT_544924 [Trichoderma harzianum CBS 226.95]PKK48725.1 hypothetical protein CI102_6929 [Trichoderma harzianum]PTB59455.1 hypothetical protein M431DRAFT_544924 [Trichoderma harzianum CBS 226.95]
MLEAKRHQYDESLNFTYLVDDSEHRAWAVPRKVNSRIRVAGGEGDWMGKLELDGFRISPSNQRIAEFHRLIKNGHFWGKGDPKFLQFPVPNMGRSRGPRLSIAH